MQCWCAARLRTYSLDVEFGCFHGRHATAPSIACLQVMFEGFGSVKGELFAQDDPPPPGTLHRVPLEQAVFYSSRRLRQAAHGMGAFLPCTDRVAFVLTPE